MAAASKFLNVPPLASTHCSTTSKQGMDNDMPPLAWINFETAWCPPSKDHMATTGDRLNVPPPAIACMFCRRQLFARSVADRWHLNNKSSHQQVSCWRWQHAAFATGRQQCHTGITCTQLGGWSPAQIKI